jgi:diadenosine tetraphosphate (Ap4A) HIT family hydrolase
MNAPAHQTPIHRKVELCERGEYPFAIAKLPSGWVCLGETQPLRGYCLIFSSPVVGDLNALSHTARAQWGVDCARIGDALIKIVGAIRVNYETWGNQDPALHTHISPRFLDEPRERRTLPPRQAYDWSIPVIDPVDPEVSKLIADLRDELRK